MPFGIAHPHLHINCSLHVWGRAQGSQIFKRNSIILIRSKVFSDFVVPTWSPSSSRRPHHPHIVPIIPTSSPHHPHHPRCRHVVPIAPRRSPCGLHGLWSPHVVPIIPVIPTSSLSSPCCLEDPHIISNPADTHCTHSPSPWGVGAPNQ